MVATLVLAFSLFHHHKKPKQEPVLPPIPDPLVVMGLDDLYTSREVNNAVYLANKAADECPELGGYVAAVRADIAKVNADDVASQDYAQDMTKLTDDERELVAQMKNYKLWYYL
jgi:hypothetical protein